jgi:hypothetical protein
MTIQEVKDNLPDVPVKYGGKVVMGWLRGRLLPFPKVFIGPRGTIGGWEVSWETATRAINTGNPILID